LNRDAQQRQVKFDFSTAPAGGERKKMGLVVFAIVLHNGARQ
jgi:hypothetical protein